MRALLAFVARLACLGGGMSCLPADTRPPAGSVLLSVVSDDDPAGVVTVDGWSVSVDRLLVGIGDASLGDGCTSYSEARYGRLLDGRLPADQKVSILFGLGACDFSFRIAWPSFDTLLGEGVTEADKELMGTRENAGDGRRPEGIAVDFAATATRGGETKRVHWMFRQATTYLKCMRTMGGEASRKIDLPSDENLAFHIGLQGAALFGDDVSPTAAVLRFDPLAAADALYGNGDDDISLAELGSVPLDMARRSGTYGVGPTNTGGVHSLEDYMYLVLLPKVVRFREAIGCEGTLGFRPD